MNRLPYIPEPYLRPVDPRDLSDTELREAMQALCEYLNVHVLKNETQDARAYEVRRLRRKSGRPKMPR